MYLFRISHFPIVVLPLVNTVVGRFVKLTASQSLTDKLFPSRDLLPKCFVGENHSVKVMIFPEQADDRGYLHSSLGQASTSGSHPRAWPTTKFSIKSDIWGKGPLALFCPHCL